MNESNPYLPMAGKRRLLSREERRDKRNKNKKGRTSSRRFSSQNGVVAAATNQVTIEVCERLVAHWPEDKLLNLVSMINNVYHEYLGKDAPFMTYVIIGMQSTGKSTMVERLLKVPLNIVQDGTGTRCPLDITVIHDRSCNNPLCELRGDELEGKAYVDLNVEETFKYINQHTKRLNDEDRFSTEALRLVFRAANVQNMRIVDLPGIISNLQKGKKDNREEIMDILRHEMEKANTKLCVLLEPTQDFATNVIVDVCDKTFGGREEWVGEATFLMTKFDKQMGDTGTGSRANNHFKEYHRNGCFPFLVSTPIIEKVGLEPAELFQARKKMLETADEEEGKAFRQWQERHRRTKKKDPTDQDLESEIRKRIGFSEARKHWRTEMLGDIIDRLPSVITELRKELCVAENELEVVNAKQRLTDEGELKKLSGEFLSVVTDLVFGYLKGDLQVTINFPDRPQNLDDEIDAEENSDWAEKSLGPLPIDQENGWRDNMATIFEDAAYPATVQPDKEFLGGKQVQRALLFSREVMIRTIPNRKVLRNYVANCTGYGEGDKENWERAMLQVVQVCLRQACHPGINYAIRHVGCIFRELFRIALEDSKVRGKHSASLKLLPIAAEKFFAEEFDALIWKVMSHAANTGHSSIEPLYEMIYPNLPEFRDEGRDVSGEPTVDDDDSDVGEEAAIKHLKQDSQVQARMKKGLLPEARTSMVTEEECDAILEKSYKYVQALMKITLVNLGFHFEKHLLKEFKEELKGFKGNLMENARWHELAQPDPVFEEQKKRVEEKIASIQKSLLEVERLRAATV